MTNIQLQIADDNTQNIDENEMIKQLEPENQIVEMEEHNQEEIAHNPDDNQSIEVEEQSDDYELAMTIYNKIKQWHEEQLQALENLKPTTN
ncbi:MAG: hypothetical protein ACKPKO_16510, partial [Candidatus Fonsibacter sp.]